uniref:Uncharacterized protein n=1 Tax=Eutreptiella gymnastica TaxID=73025 RepID=A0A7S1NFR6_9EUGL|mmetsp:Transcript_24285/g.43854  ORF Transcript_24285/g.43854 Transcript_24285/m.43854 type:complete len:785 (+) Transcript_24285:91-2445(+)
MATWGRSIACILLLLHGKVAYPLPRTESIAGIPSQELFNAPSFPFDAKSPWLGPLSEKKPQTYRTTYYPFWNSLAATTGTPPSTSLRVTFVQALNHSESQDWQIKLEAPYLEQHAYKCSNMDASAHGNCRCNVQPSDTPLHNYSVPGSVIDQMIVSTPNTSSLEFTIPNWVYFPHPPYVGQNPYIRTYRKLCLKEPNGTYWMDTTIWIAIVQGCDELSYPCNTTNANNLGRLPPSPSARTATLPDPLLGTWECNAADLLGAFYDFTTNGSQSVVDTGLVSEDFCWGESREMLAARQSRTACCGYSSSGISTGMGVCFDPSFQSCCGYKPFVPQTQACCSRQASRIVGRSQPCECTHLTEAFDCQQLSSTQPTSPAGLGWLSPQPTTGQCCTQSKYPDLSNPRGSCYNISNHAEQCCDDGTVYNSGNSQCCPVSGVQSLDVPCPCNLDSQCPTLGGIAYKCCFQRFPPPWSVGQGLEAYTLAGINSCSKYITWPTGQGAVSAQQCFGQCYNPSYQLCCNGQLCHSKFEACCNATCCNRHTSKCQTGTLGPGNTVNPNNYNVMFQVCTAHEALTPFRIFTVYVSPWLWVGFTFVVFGIASFVTKRGAAAEVDIIEKGMAIISGVLVFGSLPLLFSPVYKYAITTSVIAAFVMVAATLSSLAASVLVVSLTALLSLYMVDPFAANIILSFPWAVEERQGIAGGVQEALFRMAENYTLCTSFYDYFQLDTATHDFDRHLNPKHLAFGYCSQGWLLALLVLSELLLTVVLLLLALAIVSLAKRFDNHFS